MPIGHDGEMKFLHHDGYPYRRGPIASAIPRLEQRYRRPTFIELSSRHAWGIALQRTFCWGIAVPAAALYDIAIDRRIV